VELIGGAQLIQQQTMKRGYLVVCAVAAALLATLYATVDDRNRGRVVAAWLGALLLTQWVTVIVALRAPARPRRFLITPRGFEAPRWRYDPAVTRGQLILTVGFFAAFSLDPRGRAICIAGAVLTLVVLAATFRPFALILTPAAIVSVTPISRRTIPWDTAARMPRNVKVDPWFLAATIRWYAHHPDERAAIGTQQGYDRLLVALGVVEPNPV
jgi:hypothetical protein